MPVPARLEHLDALRDLLVASFDDDPIVQWFVRQDARRAVANHAFFDVVLRRLTLPHGLSTQTETGDGVCLVVHGDHWKLGLLEQLPLAPTILSAGGWWRALTVVRAMDALERAHHKVPGRHLYLSFLAVHPTARGQGKGSELLRPYLERCDREGLGMYLENTKSENLDFYQRHGFEVTGMIDLGTPHPPYWAMWRAPRAG